MFFTNPTEHYTFLKEAIFPPISHDETKSLLTNFEGGHLIRPYGSTHCISHLKGKYLINTIMSFNDDQNTHQDFIELYRSQYGASKLHSFQEIKISLMSCAQQKASSDQVHKILTRIYMERLQKSQDEAKSYSYMIRTGTDEKKYFCYIQKDKDISEPLYEEVSFTEPLSDARLLNLFFKNNQLIPYHNYVSQADAVRFSEQKKRKLETGTNNRRQPSLQMWFNCRFTYKKTIRQPPAPSKLLQDYIFLMKSPNPDDVIKESNVILENQAIGTWFIAKVQSCYYLIVKQNDALDYLITELTSLDENLEATLFQIYDQNKGFKNFFNNFA